MRSDQASEWQHSASAPQSEQPEKSLPACVCPQSRTELRRLERQVVAGKLVAPVRGVFADADEWEGLDAAERSRRVMRALATKHGGWVFCLFSAAVMYGLEVGRDLAWPLHVCSKRGAHYRSSKSFVRHAGNEEESCEVGGVRVTPPLKTVVDCLCSLQFDRALAVADSAMRVLGLTKEEMQSELATRGKCEGWEVATNAIAYANPKAANGGESVARAIMVEQGFMIPELQVEMRDPLDAAKRYFVDFYWRLGDLSGDVAGELDGKDKYIQPEMTGGRDALEVLTDERLRESRISAKGVRMMRFSYRDVMDVGRFTQLLGLYGIPRGAARVVGA